jgi:beta-phosphoglucomutase-like phosphatase (HAD superfamily)
VVVLERHRPGTQNGPRVGRRQEQRDVPAAPRTDGPFELEPITARWQSALDAAERALGASGGQLSASDVALRRRALVRERAETAELLAQLAAVCAIHPAPWLSPIPLTPELLGVPASARACLFDLDGVLTDSAVLHAHAWAEVFDAFLMRIGEEAGRQFAPFDVRTDYRDFMDGRPRLEGIHLFLASRGIRVREGTPDDAGDAETARGLAKRKGEAVSRGLRGRGVTELAGARRFLQATGRAGLGRVVVSASTNTLPMLELAGLADLVDERVDAAVIADEGLRSRPAPDLLLAACRRLSVAPGDAVTFTHSPAGVVAGINAGLTVVGVGDEARRELLREYGASLAVGSLQALLDPRLADHVAPTGRTTESESGPSPMPGRSRRSRLGTTEERRR